MMRQNALRMEARQSQTYPESAGFDAEQMRLLAALRRVFMRTRSAARVDLFHACAVLSARPDDAGFAYAETLMKCLPQALNKTPVIYRPFETAVSFDEAWLLRAITAAQNSDWDSFEFLIKSRVPFLARRNLGHLIAYVSEYFCIN